MKTQSEERRIRGKPNKIFMVSLEEKGRRNGTGATELRKIADDRRDGEKWIQVVPLL